MDSLRLEAESLEHRDIISKTFCFQGYIKDTEHRGITVQQLKFILSFAELHCSTWYDRSSMSVTSGKTLSMDFVNLYHVNDWIIKPATQRDNCAMVEMCTNSSQTPMWFISHWWGERTRDFLLCVKLHMETRGPQENINSNTPYWICAYANRQHALDQELVADPTQTSFFKAMRLSRGILLVLDDKTDYSGPATPFSRIWCAFEEFVALTDTDRTTPMLLDIASVRAGVAELLTDGLTQGEKRNETGWERSGPNGEGTASYAKMSREKRFPIEVVKEGLALKLENAKASVELDRVRILNCLAGRADLDMTPPLTEHENYVRLNQMLRAKFAVAVWPQACDRGQVVELGLPDILRDDREHRYLQCDFSSCKKFHDRAMAELSKGLPDHLEVLELHFCGRPVSSRGLDVLAKRLKDLSELRVLKIYAYYCPAICNRGILSLAKGFPESLCEIDLDFRSCVKLDESGAFEFWKAVNEVVRRKAVIKTIPFAWEALSQTEQEELAGGEVGTTSAIALDAVQMDDSKPMSEGHTLVEMGNSKLVSESQTSAQIPHSKESSEDINGRASDNTIDAKCCAAM